MDNYQPLPGVSGGCEHFNFIQRTDRRNLHTQLKNLVTLAKEVAAADLNKRREKLRKLLETEDKMFEQEFADSAKARLESEMRERTNKSTMDQKEASEFLKKKRVQQHINCCYEVREALRKKAKNETKICLEEQIAEKERQIARQHELECYWHRVQEVNLQREDERQKHENCMLEWRRDNIRHVLKMQIEDKELKLEEERKQKAEEVERINKLLGELRLEELHRNQTERVQAAFEYRKELLDDICRKQKARQEEKDQRCAEHRQLMSEIAKEDTESKITLSLAKQKHKKTLLEYIEYVQRMRQLESDAEKIRDDRIDDLRRLDVCTKNNIASVAKRKDVEAAKCYAELRKQICEQSERQQREQIERREDKIIENRFVHPEIPREVFLQKRRQMREDLDKQVLENQRLQVEEKKLYEKTLLKAINDPEHCRHLAEKYMGEGIDYLDPHPNWLILLDPCQNNMEKEKQKRSPQDKFDNLHIRPLLTAMPCVHTKPAGVCANLNDLGKDVQPLSGNTFVRSKII